MPYRGPRSFLASPTRCQRPRPQQPRSQNPESPDLPNTPGGHPAQAEPRLRLHQDPAASPGSSQEGAPCPQAAAPPPQLSPPDGLPSGQETRGALVTMVTWTRVPGGCRWGAPLRAQHPSGLITGSPIPARLSVRPSPCPPVSSVRRLRVHGLTIPLCLCPQTALPLRAARRVSPARAPGAPWTVLVGSSPPCIHHPCVRQSARQPLASPSASFSWLRGHRLRGQRGPILSASLPSRPSPRALRSM